MLSQNISRFDGKQIKSITLQDAKTTKGVISKKQIMVKRKYVDIDTLSKDDLIEMLEQLGVKTRIDTVETETTKSTASRPLEITSKISIPLIFTPGMPKDSPLL